MRRKYPVGIKSLETIRTDGYIYADKTELICQMPLAGTAPAPSCRSGSC